VQLRRDGHPRRHVVSIEERGGKPNEHQEGDQVHSDRLHHVFGRLLPVRALNEQQGQLEFHLRAQARILHYHLSEPVKHLLPDRVHPVGPQDEQGLGRTLLGRRASTREAKMPRSRRRYSARAYSREVRAIYQHKCKAVPSIPEPLRHGPDVP